MAAGATIEALRTRILVEIGTYEGSPRPPGGAALASGWAPIDAALPDGGLRPGETAAIEAAAGAGGVALASAWARAAAVAGEPALVVDVAGSALPHPWIEPAGATAPIWVVVPDRAGETWPAVDIALRSGAFGLVVVLDPPEPPRGTGARLVRLARARAARVVVKGRAPFAPSARIELHTSGVRWQEAPIGAAPRERTLVCRIAHRAAAPVVLHDAHTDRLRLRPRAADRRASHDRTRHTR